MGKYFNVSPATGTGGLTAQEASVTPTSDFTGRGPVNENVVVEHQDDSSVKRTVRCSRMGTEDEYSDVISTMKFQKVDGTGDTIPTSGWTDVNLQNFGEGTWVGSLSAAACWVRLTYKINLAACDFLFTCAQNSGPFSKLYVRIDGKYLTEDGSLVASPTEYPQKDWGDSGSTVYVENDPGIYSQMSVEIIAKCPAVTEASPNAIGCMWDGNSGKNKNTASVTLSVVFTQSSGSAISVTPASLDFGTSTAEKKISITSVKPWKAYVQ